MRFMHSKNVCHGDFRPSNILFQLDGLEDLSEAQLMNMLGEPVMKTIMPFTDEQLTTVPNYLVNDASFPLESSLLYATPKIAVIDFGVSFLTKDNIGSTGTPSGYAAPESCLGGRSGVGSDIWSLGATIYQLTGGGAEGFESDDDVPPVDQWEDIMGPLPEPYRTAYRENYDEEAIEDLDEPVTIELSCLQQMQACRQNETGFSNFLAEQLGAPRYDRRSPDDPSTEAYGIDECWAGSEFLKKDWIQMSIPKEKILQVTDLIGGIFKWIPQDRMAIDDIIAHEWFRASRARLGLEDPTFPRAAATTSLPGGLPHELRECFRQFYDRFGLIAGQLAANLAFVVAPLRFLYTWFKFFPRVPMARALLGVGLFWNRYSAF